MQWPCLFRTSMTFLEPVILLSQSPSVRCLPGFVLPRVVAYITSCETDCTNLFIFSISGCWSDPVYKTMKNWWSVSGICPWSLCNDSALNVSGNSSWCLLICNMSFRKSITTSAIALSSNLARLMAWPVVSLTLCMIIPILFVDLSRHNTPS